MSVSTDSLLDFVRESNAIEGILRDPTMAELGATADFLALDRLTMSALVDLVCVYQPDAVLRDRPGLDVRVGDYLAPPGGRWVREVVEAILTSVSENSSSPYEMHRSYENLHPFTDGNGRSGRTIWKWHVNKRGGTPLGFLHWWYYATLAK